MMGPRVSGPKLDRGAYLAEWATHPLKPTHLIYPSISSIFLYVGLCSLHFLPCRTRCNVRCVGCDRDDQHASISWTLIHRITIDARDNLAAVDFIDEIVWLRLIGYSSDHGATRGRIWMLRWRSDGRKIRDRVMRWFMRSLKTHKRRSKKIIIPNSQ